MPDEQLPEHTSVTQGALTAAVAWPDAERHRDEYVNAPVGFAFNLEVRPPTEPISPDYRHFFLRRPFPVSLERTDSGWLATDHISSRFGEGESLAEAIDDLFYDVAAYFESLQRNRGHLGRWPAHDLDCLESYIRGGMAGQLHVRKKGFTDTIDCTVSRGQLFALMRLSPPSR